MMLDTLTQDLNTLKLVGDSSTLASLLKVQDLPLKGRGYVATQDLPAGTLIHTSLPLATVVSEEWRPETCMGCFEFSYPKRTKVKAVSTSEETLALSRWWRTTVKTKKTLPHVAFCTEDCKQDYLDHARPEEWYTWLTCMYRLEHYKPTATTTTTTTTTTMDDFEDPTDILDDDEALRVYLDKVWDQATIQPIDQDELDDSDRTMCRFIATCLVKHKTCGSDFDELWHMQDNELGHFRYFYKQDSSRQNRIPEPIQHAIRLYRYFSAAMTHTTTTTTTTDSIPIVLGPHDLTSSLFRAIYYREMANSFGLWEQHGNTPSSVITDDLELLGFGIYPSAVYFNHACDANAIKIRQGRLMLFYTNRAITQGEEICISYGNVEAPKKERQQRLLDHYYFECACTRCRSEK